MIKDPMTQNCKSRILQAVDDDPRSDRAISFAVELGVNTINELRNTDKSPNIDKVLKLAEELGLSLGYVFWGTDSDTSPIQGESQILKTLKRMEGLNEKDVTVVLSIISNAIRVNAAAQLQSLFDDQLELSTHRYEPKP